MQVVDLCAVYREIFAGALAPLLRDRHTLSAAEIGAGLRFLALHNVLERAGTDDLAAVYAGARSDVHDIIRGTHGVVIVLDHDQRIARIAQALHCCNELFVVALVQTDARLIEDIEHVDQLTADLGGETDALTLTT